MKKAKDRSIPSLDGIRAVSILAVIISHLSVGVYYRYSDRLGRTGSLIQTLMLVGHLGVMFFFVVSGYLITTLLLASEQIDLAKFYFRRAFRIFVPFYFYLLVIALCIYVGVVDNSWQSWMAAVTYTSNYFLGEQGNNWFVGHTWSLSVEEQFYIAWPLVLINFPGKKWVYVACLLLLACPVFRYIFILYNPAELPEFGRFELIADTIMIGAVLAGIRVRLHALHLYHIILYNHYTLLLLIPLTLFITWFVRFSEYYSKSLYVLIAITTQNVLIAMIIDWCMANYEGRVGRLLNSPVMSFVGRISYSLYLWQQFFLNPSSQIPIFCKILLIGMVGVLSYYLIEMPALYFRGRIEFALGRSKNTVELAS